MEAVEDTVEVGKVEEVVVVDMVLENKVLAVKEVDISVAGMDGVVEEEGIE